MISRQTGGVIMRLFIGVAILISGVVIGLKFGGYQAGYQEGSTAQIQDGTMHWGKQTETCWWSDLSEDGTLLGVQCRAE